MVDANGLPIDALVARQRPGFTLERPFYTDAAIFARELDRIVTRHWLMVDHVSRLGEPGAYMLYEIAGESIILVRDGDGAIHAHYNVCRHRGSRICSQPSGTVRRLICPYHNWSYGLDGRLLDARRMRPDFDPAAYGLHPCRVRVFEGLIFVSLADDDAVDFEPIAHHLGPFLAPHGLARAKIAHREVYPTPGNWKLAVENFRECYHCAPSHREYTRVNAFVRAVEWHERFGGGYAKATEAWAETARAMGHKVGRGEWGPDGTPRLHMAWREPIRPGFDTLSEDGAPVAPLMGDLSGFDGGQTVAFLTLSFFYVANDHATLFRFTPVSPTHTEVVLTWLVDADAEEGPDYDVERLTWMWRTTTLQDTKLIADNQAGVNSRRYTPGPYAEGEHYAEAFTRWYLATIA